jgi:predicted Zn finger-like uncharacterized protein
MKFTCESCSAHYMISDEKVGPNGVKVRCKKCGNVVVVRRAVADEAPRTDEESGNGAAHPGNGLDAELGQAFETAFGDPPATAAVAAPAPAGADLAATQLMGAEDQVRIAAPAAAATPAPATEWYVAIGQAQVGPLPLAEVKRKWEAGDVGPDSLVWRPGMADWQGLSSVAELASTLAPVTRTRTQPARAEQSQRTEQPQRTEPQGGREQPAAAAGDVTWKPAGASALAALASEEISARTAPEPKPAPAASTGGGAKSLVDALPDGGGVDPTGAIPLTIKGMERTGEKKIERRSSVASRAEEARQRRTARVAAVAAAVAVVVAGGAAAYVLSQRKAPPAAAPVAVAPPPSPAPAPAPAAPPPAAPAAAPAAPPAPAQPVAAAAPPAAPAAAAPSAAEPAPAAPAPQHAAKQSAPSRRTAKAERRTKADAPTARAAPAPAPEPPPPAPTTQSGRKKDSLLDFGSNDSALNEALGGGNGSGRSVYVPPARGGAGALPDKLSPAQINESVAGRIDALRRCVSDQKSRDPGTSGVLKLRWIISADGGVRDVKTLTTEYASTPFAHCITGVVKTIRFPKSTTTGQEVTFPFSF